MYANEVINQVIKNEGGYVNDPNDPGGETKFGISKRSYPHLDIKNLTKDEAFNIYLIDFYKPLNISSLNSYKLQYSILDFSVHSGIYRAVKILQETLNDLGAKLQKDGKLGPLTLSILKKITSKNETLLFQKYNNLRLNFLKRLDDFSIYGNGWTKRINKILNTKPTYSTNILILLGLGLFGLALLKH